MKPDHRVDFDNLLRLYGSPSSDSGNDNEKNEGESSNEKNEETEIKEKKKKNSNKRNLQRVGQVLKDNYKVGRLLHQSETHEVYEYDLGNGNRILTTLLLAKED